MSGGEKKRVCHLGMGTSIHVQRWVNYFAERDWDVDLITFEPANEDLLNPKIRQHIIRTGNMKGIGFLRAYFGIRKLIKKIEPDIIHAHSIPAYGIYAGLYASLDKKKSYIVSAWGFNHIKTYKGVKRWLDKRCVKKASIIAGTSWQIKKALKESYGATDDKFLIFSWGIDTKVFHDDYEKEIVFIRNKLKIDNNAKVIISPRNMSSYYRIQNIIRAIPKIIETNPNTVFVFLRGFGSEKFEKEMKKEAELLGIKENVRFISRILPPEEMAIYLNISDIMVSIVRTDQLSSVILEGMFCGCIPILSDIDIYKTHIEHGKNGFFVNGDDVEELTETILFCLNNPNIREEIANKNRAIILEKEDWYKNAKKMEEAYKKLLS